MATDSVDEDVECFVTGDDCLAVIESDQKKFEMENIFNEFDAANHSQSSTQSWSLLSHISLTPPFKGDLGDGDQNDSLHHVTIGSFIAEKTETLGFLDGRGDSGRPTFGIRISTPPLYRKPHALLDEFNESSTCSSDESQDILDQTLTPQTEDGKKSASKENVPSENAGASINDNKGEEMAVAVESLAVTNKWTGPRNRSRVAFVQQLDRIDEVSMERSSTGSSTMTGNREAVKRTDSLKEFQVKTTLTKEVQRDKHFKSSSGVKEVLANSCLPSVNSNVPKVGSGCQPAVFLPNSVSSKFVDLYGGKTSASTTTVSSELYERRDRPSWPVVNETTTVCSVDVEQRRKIEIPKHRAHAVNVPQMPDVAGKIHKSVDSSDVNKFLTTQNQSVPERSLLSNIPAKILDTTDSDRNSTSPDFRLLPPSINADTGIVRLHSEPLQRSHVISNKFRDHEKDRNRKSPEARLQQKLIFEKIQKIAASGELSIKFRNALSSTISRLNGNENMGPKTDSLNHVNCKGKENAHPKFGEVGPGCFNISSENTKNVMSGSLPIQKPNQNAEWSSSNGMLKSNGTSVKPMPELHSLDTLEVSKAHADKIAVHIHPAFLTDVGVSSGSSLSSSSTNDAEELQVVGSRKIASKKVVHFSERDESMQRQRERLVGTKPFSGNSILFQETPGNFGRNEATKKCVSVNSASSSKMPYTEEARTSVNKNLGLGKNQPLQGQSLNVHSTSALVQKSRVTAAPSSIEPPAVGKPCLSGTSVNCIQPYRTACNTRLASMVSRYTSSGSNSGFGSVDLVGGPGMLEINNKAFADNLERCLTNYINSASVPLVHGETLSRTTNVSATESRAASSAGTVSTKADSLKNVNDNNNGPLLEGQVTNSRLGTNNGQEICLNSKVTAGIQCLNLSSSDVRRDLVKRRDDSSSAFESLSITCNLPFDSYKYSQVSSSENSSSSDLIPVLKKNPRLQLGKSHSVTETTSVRHDHGLFARSSSVAVCDQTKSFAEYSVVAPPELRIYDVCCVGLSAHDNLRIKNPTEHWIKVTFEVVKVTIDGQETSDCSVCPFTLKSHAVVEPNHTQEIKVIFAPRVSGVFVAQLYLHCGPVLDDQNMEAYDKLPVMVTLQAIAEKPSVQVNAQGGGNILHLGSVPWSCNANGSLSLINRGRASIPVRLKISSISSMSWFSFEKQSDNCSSQIPNKRNPVTSLIYSCTLPSMEVAGCFKPSVVQVHFVAPNRQHGAAEEFKARVCVEVDSLMPFHLGMIDLIATAGTAKLHIPRPMKNIILTDDGQNNCLVPLRNAGNIPIAVDLQISKFSELFEVLPSGISLQPGEDLKIKLILKYPIGSAMPSYESSLLMIIKPDGPAYKISLNATKNRSMDDSTSLKQLGRPRRDILPLDREFTDGICKSGKGDSKRVTFEEMTKPRAQISSPDCYITQFVNVDDYGKDTCNKENGVGSKSMHSCLTRDCAIRDVLSCPQQLVEDPDSCIYAIPERDIGTSPQHPVPPHSVGELEISDTGYQESESVDSHNSLLTVKPDKLILPSSCSAGFYEPVIKRFKIINQTMQDMSYQLIWPEKYITVTPEGGTVLQRSSTIVCVSSNSDLQEKERLDLPWSGTICISTETGDLYIGVKIIPGGTVSGRSLVDSPVMHSDAISRHCGKLASVVIPKAEVETEAIQKRLNFHPTIVRDTTEEIVILKNLSSFHLKWSVSAFAPAYIKKPWQMGCSRLLYSVFWLPLFSGIIHPHGQVEIVICFCPHEVGQFSQFWEVFFEITNAQKQASDICRIELFAHSVSETDAASTESDCNICDGNTEAEQAAHVSYDNRSDIPSRDSTLSVNAMELNFSTTPLNRKATLKLKVKNHGDKSCSIKISDPDQPFYSRCPEIRLERRHFLCVPFDFLPRATGCYTSQTILKSENGDTFVIRLKGVCN